MQELDPNVKRYIEPVRQAVSDGLLEIENRRIRRNMKDWYRTDYELAAATARRLAEDLNWIATTLEVVSDVNAGALNAED